MSAPAFDIVVEGGELLNPGGPSGRLDVGIRGDRIASIDPDLSAAPAARRIDATGALVLPGLVDFHTHVYWGSTYWGIRPDPIAARTGVTSWIDAGSAGAFNFAGLREFVVVPAKVRVKAFINVSGIGLTPPNGELADLRWCDLDALHRVLDANRTHIVGIKVRLGRATVGENGAEPLRIALRAAEAEGLPVMVHIANGPPPIREVLPLLRPGDVVTHCFTGNDMRIVADEGGLLELAREAHDAGVVFDLGHGSGSFSWSTAEAALEAGCPPDVISTDMHQLSARGPMFDLGTCMSKLLHLGMPLEDVVRAATTRPAALAGLEGEAGTLAPGARADLAVFELEEGDFPLYDSKLVERRAGRRLLHRLTVCAGRPLEPAEQERPEPFIEMSEDWMADQRRWLEATRPSAPG